VENMDVMFRLGTLFYLSLDQWGVNHVTTMSGLCDVVGSFN